MEKQKTKKPAPRTTAEMMAELGLAQEAVVVKEVQVYKLWRHNRGRLDHTKYPHERWSPVEDSPIFAIWSDADKARKKLEKTNEHWLYEPRLTRMPETDVPKDLLKKIKARGW